MYICVCACVYTSGPTMHTHEHIPTYMHTPIRIIPKRNYVSTITDYAKQNGHTTIIVHSKACVPTLLSALQTRR